MELKGVDLAVPEAAAAEGDKLLKGAIRPPVANAPAAPAEKPQAVDAVKKAPEKVEQAKQQAQNGAFAKRQNELRDQLPALDAEQEDLQQALGRADAAAAPLLAQNCNSTASVGPRTILSLSANTPIRFAPTANRPSGAISPRRSIGPPA